MPIFEPEILKTERYEEDTVYYWFVEGAGGQVDRITIEKIRYGKV